MNRNKMRLATLGLTLALVLTVVFGCSSSGGGNNGGGATSGTSGTNGTSGTGGTAAQEEVPASDSAAERSKIKFYYVKQDRRANASGDQEVVRYINEKFNVDYQRVDIPPDQINEKMNVILASGEQIDAFNAALFGTDPKSVPSLRKSKSIQPLNDYLNKYGPNLLQDVPPDVWRYVTDEEGNIWGVPEMGFKVKQFLFVRQDWLDRLNLTAPATIEELEETLYALRDGDPDGNGKNDTYPMVFTDAAYISSLMGSFMPDGSSWWEDADGTIKPPFMHPNYKSYLATLNKWYTEKLLHPEFLTLNREQAKDVIVRGISGVYPAWHTLSYQDEIAKVNPAAEVAYIPFPVGPSGTSGGMSDGIARSAFVIHSNTKPEVAERIIEVVDWLQTQEGTDFSWYGIEGEHWVRDGEFIVPAPGIDPDNPAYKAQYYFNAGNSWKYFTESPLVRPPLTSITRQAALRGEYRSIDGAEYMFPYDWSATKSKDLLSDLSKMESEMFAKIVLGQAPVDWLDDWIREWRSKGGDTHMSERNEQYWQLKPDFGAKP